MSGEEVPLGGGRSVDGVVRVGDTVRRPPQHATQLMRDVLVLLEERGFDAAPRWLGFDEQGRDVLSWIEGETFADRRELTDAQLAACARLLRRYHDTMLDFDNAHPGRRAEDVGYALWKFDIVERAGTFVAAYEVEIDADEAIEYAKACERGRFARNGWPVDF